MNKSELLNQWKRNWTTDFNWRLVKLELFCWIDESILALFELSKHAYLVKLKKAQKHQTKLNRIIEMNGTII